MAAANYDAAQLETAGSINEDVMAQIFDISPIDIPYTNRAGTENSSHQFTEWTTDVLAAVDPTNAVIDGADAGTDDSADTTRVGNHHQISDKVLRVSGRARAVNTIGRGDELAYQLLQRGKELRRDCEGIKLINQASVADTGSTAGRLGGVPAWFETNTSRGAGGADGGFAAGLVTLPTVGTKRALTETILRDVIESAHISGGEPNVIMVTPKMKRKISEYLFSSSARIGTITTETGQGQNQSVAIGAVDVFVSDFGALEIISNRFILDYLAQDNGGGAYGGADEVDVFVMDFMYWATCFLRGFRTEPLAKTGDADNRQMLVDYSVIAKNESSSALIADIDQSVAMTA